MFLQTNAEDFFNAYEVLKESNEALINKLANSPGNPSAAKAFGARPTMGVEIVCLAFSVELYIKYLHYVIKHETPRGHDILTLFRDLPEQTQQKIFSHPSITNYGWSFPEFEKQIGYISDGFAKWRYSHEFTTLQYNSYFALVFIDAVKFVSASERSHLAIVTN
ncbi:MAG: HEPN domain-containing protein [Gallionella sp.]